MYYGVTFAPQERFNQHTGASGLFRDRKDVAMIIVTYCKRVHFPDSFACAEEMAIAEHTLDSFFRLFSLIEGRAGGAGGLAPINLFYHAKAVANDLRSQRLQQLNEALKRAAKFDGAEVCSVEHFFA